MIEYIYRNASQFQLLAAHAYATTRMRIADEDITLRGAVGFVCMDFQEGDFTGWGGFVKCLEP